jgi:hypothetical protein
MRFEPCVPRRINSSIVNQSPKQRPIIAMIADKPASCEDPRPPASIGIAHIAAFTVSHQTCTITVAQTTHDLYSVGDDKQDAYSHSNGGKGSQIIAAQPNCNAYQRRLRNG